MVPPERLRTIGSSLSFAANRQKGSIACRMSIALAALDSAEIRKFRCTSSLGDSREMNVSVLEPTLSPSTSASVTSASHWIEATCWFLRPEVAVSRYPQIVGPRDLPPPFGRLPRIFVILMGWVVKAARPVAIRITCPPPSPVLPSIWMGFPMMRRDYLSGDFGDWTSKFSNDAKLQLALLLESNSYMK